MSKFCNACGKQVKDDLNFCPYCGYQFHQETTNQSKEPKSYMKIGIISLIIIITMLVLGITYINSIKDNYQKQLQELDNQKRLEQQEKETLQQQQLIEEQNSKLAEQLKQQEYEEELQRQQDQAEKEKQFEIEQQELEYQQQEDNLNSDKDNDGLTLREETKLGTDPNNKDSDNDGIIDSEDTHPTGGGRYLSIQVGEVNIVVHSDYFDYYKNKKRTPYSSSVFGDTYVQYNEKYIDDIYKQLLNISKNKGVNVIDEIITFVQDLDYVYDTTLGIIDYPKYPIETLIEETGDCEDTSILMASLLKRAGYDVVLLNPPEHIAVGVRCDFNEGYVIYDKKKYCYVESTGNNWRIGKVPSKYLDDNGELIVNYIYPISGVGIDEIKSDDYNTKKFIINNDWDNDEVLNEDDNCPVTDNPKQEDIDNDNVGDVCDLCKNYYGISELNEDKYPEAKYVGCHPCESLSISDSCWDKEEYNIFQSEKLIQKKIFDEYLAKLQCEAEGGTWNDNGCLI